MALELLDRLGFHADLAVDGAEAVELALEGGEQYDLLLADVNMPELDGVQVMAHVREALGPACPSIVFLTANAMKSDRDNLIKQGADGYLSKPIRMEALAKGITELLVDYGQFDSLFEMSGAAIFKVFEKFVEEVPAGIEALKAVEADHEALRQQAHQLKGRLATFGLRGCARVMGQIERGAEFGGSPSFDSELLTSGFNLLIRHLRERLVEMGIAKEE